MLERLRQIVEDLRRAFLWSRMSDWLDDSPRASGLMIGLILLLGVLVRACRYAAAGYQTP